MLYHPVRIKYSVNCFYLNTKCLLQAHLMAAWLAANGTVLGDCESFRYFLTIHINYNDIIKQISTYYSSCAIWTLCPLTKILTHHTCLCTGLSNLSLYCLFLEHKLFYFLCFQASSVILTNVSKVNNRTASCWYQFIVIYAKMKLENAEKEIICILHSPKYL